MEDYWGDPQLFSGSLGLKYIVARNDVITEAELKRGGKIGVTGQAEEDASQQYAGRIILDIGSHYGGFGVWAARKYPDSIVHAWEPQRQLFYELCGNIAINHLTNIYPHHEAVGQKPEEILIPDVDLKTFRNPGAMRLRGSQGLQGLPMHLTKIVTIDSYDFKDVALIKIDVEGMELEVLAGARQTIIRSMPKIIVESWTDGKNRGSVLDFLARTGYNAASDLGDDIVAEAKKEGG